MLKKSVRGEPSTPAHCCRYDNVADPKVLPATDGLYKNELVSFWLYTGTSWPYPAWIRVTNKTITGKSFLTLLLFDD